MAQQLNLFDASLRPQRVWITPTRLLPQFLIAQLRPEAVVLS